MRLVGSAFAREELYCELYNKYLLDNGPYLGEPEFDEMCKSNPHIRRAAVFAMDMGHIKASRYGGLSLTPLGVLYVEEEYLKESVL